MPRRGGLGGSSASAVWGLCAVGAMLAVSLVLPASSVRGREGLPRLALEHSEPVAEFTLVAAPAEPVPLAFRWAPRGSVRVRAEHLRHQVTTSETFDLAWRELASGELFVEAFPIAPPQAVTLPGPLRVSGTLLAPVQGIVSSAGRFAGVPNEDSLRVVWGELVGHPFAEPPPGALAACWTDCVERWIGVALAPGSEQVLDVRPSRARATIRCESLDVERVRLQYRLARPRPAGLGEDEPWAELEQGVDAELWTDGLRPRVILAWSRWTLHHSAGDIVRSRETGDRYEFDWTELHEPARDAGAFECEPPEDVAAWAERTWPWLSSEVCSVDAAWWRELWPALDVRRRGQIAANLAIPTGDFASGRGNPLWWASMRPHLRRLWLGEEPLERSVPLVRTWVESGPPEGSVDVLFVGDGYTAADLAPEGKYWSDVCRVAAGMLEEIPLVWYRDWFNVRAVFLESRESGCDTGDEVDEVDTALDTCFSSQRANLIFVRDEPRLEEVVRDAGGADIVLVMVNVQRHGGAGGKMAKPGTFGRLARPVFTNGCSDPVDTAVHEIGHSFANLADEYVDEEQARMRTPLAWGEPVAPNVTLSRKKAPYLKWAHFLELPGAERYPWRHEGAYYLKERAFRPWPRCRMDDSSDPFCPVCCEALAHVIEMTCGLQWNDAAYHRAHPLEIWSQ